MTQLGSLIKEARMKRNWSQIKLGKVLGTSGQFIGRIEHGTSPLPFSHARKLRKIFRRLTKRKIQRAYLIDYKNKLKKV